MTEGSLLEMTAAGTIDFGDVDLNDAHVTSVMPDGAGYLGTFVADVTNDSTGDGSGQVTWLFSANNALRQSISAGQVLVQTYTVVIDDGQGGTASQLVTITITGTNNAAVITGDSIGAVVEAGGVNNGIPGTPTDSGDLFADDTDDADNSWEAVGSPTASANGYGTFTVSEFGVWIYTLDNNNAAVQALNGTATLTDSFTVATVDGTEQLVTVTIAAQNDAPVITGDAAGNVIEAGGVNNGTAGVPTDSGDLNSTDVDNSADGWQVVLAGAATANGYGSYALSAAGVWTYTLNDSNAAVQGLNVGGALADSFTVATIDGTLRVVSITIDGANDAAVITGDAAGDVIEAGGINNGAPGVPTDIGDLDSTDVDNPADAWQAVAAGAATVNGYGSYALTAAGVWTYTLDNSNAAVQGLNGAATLTDSFTALTEDGTAHVVSITITGANDTPVAVADGNAGDAVIESGVVAGDPSAAGNVLTNDTDVDTGDSKTVTEVNGSALNVGAPLVGIYGTLTLLADGSWSYALNDADLETNALAEGQVVTDVFSYTVSDANGATSSAALTITITGGNDAPVVTGAVDSGEVTEGALPVMVADGTIDFGDVDLTDAHVTSVTPGGTGYLGTFAADVTNVSTGDGIGQVTWLFAANNVLRQSLGDGQVLVQTYTVVIDDGRGGTDSQLVTITITGTNDAAVITGDSTGAVVEAGGVNNAIPGTPTDSGDLNSTDVDDPADSWEEVVAPTASANGYGTFTITAAGVWTYTLDNSNPTVQSLPAGGSIDDSFTVATIDGTSQVVSITITGTNDAPVAVADGNGGDAVIESGIAAGDPSAAGNVLTNDIDPDIGDSRTVTAVNGSALNVGAPLVGIYGTLTLLADGSWSYALNDADPDTNALAQGQLVSDAFSYTVSDTSGAISSAALTITITGGNDAPVVTGAVDNGTVTEDLPPEAAVGTIDFGDVDLNDAHVTSVTPGGAGYLGTFTASVTNASTGDGVGQVTWQFAANNALLQFLNDNQVLVQTYTVGIADGHGGTASQLVTVTINGTNDAAVISGDSIGAVVEAGGVNNAIAGTPTDSGNLDSTDVDDPADSWEAVVSQTASANGYGTFTITAAGVWTYTLDNTNAAVQAIPAGGSLADSFTVATLDGTSQVVSITITGSNDAPVAVADGNGSDLVIESGVNPGDTPFAGDPSATGNVLTNDTDVDTGDTRTVTAVNGAAVNVGQPLVGIYGTLTLLADGSWSYALNNADPDTNALAQGQVVTDAFTYTMADANGATSSAALTIAITGTNDAPVAVADGNAGDAVTESGVVTGDPSAAGNVLTNDTDVDTSDSKTVTAVNGSALNVGAPLVGIYGTLTLLANGSWTYALNNTDPDTDALMQGQIVTDAFTYTMADANGASSAAGLTITITGTNDAPVAVDDSNAGDAVTETGVVVGDPSAAGNVLTNDTDVDTGDTRTVTAVNGATANVGAPLVGLYGTLTLLANGSWTYTLNDADPDTNALTQGQAASDAFTYTVSDANGGSSTAALTIAITGANDAPVAVDDGNAGDAVTESGVVVGDPSATGNVLTNDIDPDSGDTKTVTEVNGSAANAGASLVGTYGTLTLLADGSWTYTLNDADPDTNALAQGQIVTHVVTYSVSDTSGATSSASLTITITGGNDAPVVTGAVDSGEVTEGSQPVLEVDGTIDFGDVDLNDAHVTSVTPGEAG